MKRPHGHEFAVRDFIGMCSNAESASAWLLVKIEDHDSPEFAAELAVNLRHQRARRRAESILERIERSVGAT